MKKIHFLAFLSILFIFNQNIIFAQQSDSWLDKDDPISYAKLYLHTDRETYFVGDSIWFKAYYVNGQTHEFINRFQTKSPRLYGN